MKCSNLLSRELKIAAGTESRTVFSPNFDYGHQYRLSIRETSGNNAVKITVELLHTQSTEDLEFHVGRNGAYALTLSGACRISASNPSGVDISISAAITGMMPLVDLIEFDEGAVVLGAAYADLGSNGGFPQAYYNYAGLYLSAAADVRLVTGAGGTVFEVLGITPGSLLLNQFRVGDNLRLQARGVGVTAALYWYNRR